MRGLGVDLLTTVADRATRTYVDANNHDAGHGPATIRQLQELVAARRAGDADARG